MRRRAQIINGTLVLAWVGIGIGGYALLRSPAKAAAAEQTATASRGTVAATVDASGNA